jgi:signal transduction histidine kinase
MVAELKATPVHQTLKKVVVWFRLLAFGWMTALVVATLLSDHAASLGWVWVAEGAALFTVGATFVLARLDRLDSWWWLVADGAITAFIVMSPGIAGAENLFYGGFGLSWLLVVVWAYPAVLPAAVAIAVLVVAQLVGSELGIRDIQPTDLVGDIAVWIVSGIVYGWALWALRVTDVDRQRAEAALTDERIHTSLVEARATIADDIHDSVLQTLGYIRGHCDDGEIVAIASEQDRQLRRYLDRITARFPDGLEVLLRAAAWDVEDRYDVQVEVVSVNDRERDDIVEVMVAAAREAMVNAAKHSGAGTLSVYSEVDDGVATIFVKDRGAGFEVSDGWAGHRGIERSIVRRLDRVGGSARISSTPGVGTEVELSVPGGSR